MDAVPIGLGQEFAAYATSMRRCEGVLEYAVGLLKEVGPGGFAVRTGVNTHPKFRKLVVRHLSKTSRQALRPTDDLRYAMQSNLAMSVASSALRNLALELSAMVGFQAIGADMVTAMAVQAGQLELNVMMPTMAWNVLHSAEILKNTMRALATKCVGGISAKEGRCRYYANATTAIATALNPYIGYAAAAEIEKESVKTGRPVVEIALERNVLDESTLRKIPDPMRMTTPTGPIKQTLRKTMRKTRKS
jgi:aspartate ammonia-lyase